MYGFIRKTFRWCYRNFYSKKQNDKKHSTTRIRILMQGEIKAPSTLIRFQTKTELFCPGYGYRPHYNAENDHRKRSHSKTLSRVERFENDARRCSVDERKRYENDKGGRKFVWKRSKKAPFSFENGLVWTGPKKTTTATATSLNKGRIEQNNCYARAL